MNAQYLFTVVLQEVGNGNILTNESWGKNAEEAAKKLQSNIRTITRVVATISGQHENKYVNGIQD